MAMNVNQLQERIAELTKQRDVKFAEHSQSGKEMRALDKKIQEAKDEFIAASVPAKK